MMKVYKVEIERLSFDMGHFLGWIELGYFTSKAKAERVAKETYENRCPIDRGNTRITEIEVDDEEA